MKGKENLDMYMHNNSDQLKKKHEKISRLASGISGITENEQMITKFSTAEIKTLKSAGLVLDSAKRAVRKKQMEMRQEEVVLAHLSNMAFEDGVKLFNKTFPETEGLGEKIHILLPILGNYVLGSLEVDKAENQDDG